MTEAGKRPRGRPRLGRMHRLQSDVKEHQLGTHLAQNKDSWINAVITNSPERDKISRGEQCEHLYYLRISLF